jgi:hypothetical protein
MRSTTVVLGSVGLLAAALSSCSSDPDRRCVDRDSYRAAEGYKVVSDKNCKSAGTAVNGAWYYGGKTKDGRVRGGSFTKPGKGSGGHGGSGGIDRGGFGGGKGKAGG